MHGLQLGRPAKGCEAVAEVNGGAPFGVRAGRSATMFYQAGDFTYGIHPLKQVRVAPPHALSI